MAKANLPETEAAWISRVIDGDTVVTFRDEHIRLIGIDAPEMKQRHGVEAKEALHGMIFNSALGGFVFLRRYGTDRYDRTLGELFTSTKMDNSINRQMVEQGHAWYYPSPEAEKNGTVDPHGDFNGVELRARLNARGLWADTDPPPMRPKTYRKQKRAESRAKKAAKKKRHSKRY